MPNWQRRRSFFNHDWLKNQYLQNLGRWERLMNDEVEDPDFERRFVTDVLPNWEQHVKVALIIIKEFEVEMSPRALFAQPPLSRCEGGTRAWLPELVHALWLARYPVLQWVSDAWACLESAMKAYAELSARLSQCARRQSAEALQPLRTEFARFRCACLELATAIERFPDRILIE